MIRTTIAAAAVTVAAAPAFAGNLTPVPVEPYVAPPAPVAAAPASLDWTGFYVGAQVGYGRLEDTTRNEEDDGVVGGVHAGYDFDYGNLVLGVGIDVDATDITLPNSQLDTLVRGRIRAGIDSGNFLFYGVGGPEWADASITGTTADNDVGYFVGAGVEYRINQNLSAGVEGLYHQFDDFDNTGTDFNFTSVQARVSYRF
jgi:opacity protein-like surface antigen